jgi:DNA-binding CsgD family transcriptional regulator
LILINLRRRYKTQIKEADKKLATLVEQLNESNQEKQLIRQEIQEFLKDKDKRLELETLTPHILKESGETKFRQCFELLYPLFLHRLREKVPSITRREEVLSMLIILKQDNKIIADLLGIAPRSVLMLRHRFRQKIGIETELSLDSFIEDLAGNIF